MELFSIKIRCTFQLVSTDKKEEKQSAAEKYRSIVMVGQYIAKFVE